MCQHKTKSSKGHYIFRVLNNELKLFPNQLPTYFSRFVKTQAQEKVSPFNVCETRSSITEIYTQNIAQQDLSNTKFTQDAKKYSMLMAIVLKRF